MYFIYFSILTLAFQALFVTSSQAEPRSIIPFKLQQETPAESFAVTELRDAVEARLFEKSNEWRLSKKLQRLESSALLLEVARDYSRDMLRRNYFSHYSPEGKMVLDRIQKVKPGFDEDCGENLHQIYSPSGLKDPKAIADQILEDWLHSTSHRKNLMANNFNFMVIGCAATEHKIYCTQIFSAKDL